MAPPNIIYISVQKAPARWEDSDVTLEKTTKKKLENRERGGQGPIVRKHRGQRLGKREGDIKRSIKGHVPKTVELTKKNKEFYGERRWPLGIVRYVITKDENYDLDDLRQRLEEVNRILKERTCARIEEISEEEANQYDDYLVLDASADYITGRTGGRQTFGSLELFEGGQHKQHTAMMVMAMLGFYFELARHDRDTHVRVHMRHVRPDKLHHFEKIRSDATLALPYDYESATHPAWQFWRKIGKTGISTVATYKEKDPDGSIMRALGQHDQLLSELDIVKINTIYGVKCFMGSQVEGQKDEKDERINQKHKEGRGKHRDRDTEDRELEKNIDPDRHKIKDDDESDEETNDGRLGGDKNREHGTDIEDERGDVRHGRHRDEERDDGRFGKHRDEERDGRPGRHREKERDNGRPGLHRDKERDDERHRNEERDDGRPGRHRDEDRDEVRHGRHRDEERYDGRPGRHRDEERDDGRPKRHRDEERDDGRHREDERDVRNKDRHRNKHEQDKAEESDRDDEGRGISSHKYPNYDDDMEEPERIRDKNREESEYGRHKNKGDRMHDQNREMTEDDRNRVREETNKDLEEERHRHKNREELYKEMEQKRHERRPGREEYGRNKNEEVMPSDREESSHNRYQIKDRERDIRDRDRHRIREEKGREWAEEQHRHGDESEERERLEMEQEEERGNRHGHREDEMRERDRNREKEEDDFRGSNPNIGREMKETEIKWPDDPDRDDQVHKPGDVTPGPLVPRGGRGY